MIKEFITGGLVVSGIKYFGQFNVLIASIIGALPIGLASSYLIKCENIIEYINKYIIMLCIAILSAYTLQYNIKNNIPKKKAYTYTFTIWLFCAISMAFFIKPNKCN